MSEQVLTLKPVPSVPVHLEHVKRIRNGDVWSLDQVPLAKLRVDTAYQRDFSASSLKHIARIAQDFDWAKFSPIIVAPAPDDRFAIIDGQHRAAAARARGISLLPAYILTISQREQAAAFAAINGAVQPMSSLHIWKAALAAAEDWAVEMKEVCDGAGIKVLTYPKAASVIQPGETMCVTVIRAGIARVGAPVARMVLAALRSETNRQLSPGKDILKPLFGVADDYSDDPERVAQALAEADLKSMLYDARRSALEAELDVTTMMRGLMIDQVREYGPAKVKEAAE